MPRNLSVSVGGLPRRQGDDMDLPRARVLSIFPVRATLLTETPSGAGPSYPVPHSTRWRE